MFEPNCVVAITAPEISLKSKKVRERINTILKRNVTNALKENQIKFNSISFRTGRLFIYTTQTKKTFEILKNCFGIYQLFLAQRLKFDLKKENSKEEIINFGASLCSDFKDDFAIRCRSRFNEIKSKEIEMEIGSKVIKEKKRSVNLTKPKYQLNVLIYHDKVFYYFKEEKGISGMPVGMQGNVLLYVTNKKRSEKLAFLLMKTGCSIITLNKKLKLNSSHEFDFLENEKIEMYFRTGRARAVFCDSDNLKESTQLSEKLGVKVFSPEILNPIKTPFN